MSAAAVVVGHVEGSLLEKELSTAMKSVGQAIQLDTLGKNREAYLHYLSCIQYISRILLEDAKQKASTGSAMQSTATRKMLKLVHQCTERSTALFQIIDETDSVVSILHSVPAATSPTPQPQTTTHPTSESSTATNIVQTTHHNVVQQVPLINKGVPPPENPNVVFPSPLIVTSGANPSYEFPPVPTLSPVHMSQGAAVSPPSYVHTRPHPSTGSSPTTTGCQPRKRSPLEMAFRENKKLMAAYRARLARMQSKKNRAAMSLTLQRRLMENMAIAKSREAALAKKIQERLQRLQEEVARRFSSGGESTVQEMELRQTYASAMEFENHANWLQEWRLKLQESPLNLQLIHELITLILSCKEHPLTQQLQRYQFAVYKLIYPLIQKNTEHINENIVPFHNVTPLQLSAGVEPRIIPSDGFMTPDDQSKNIDEDLMKRLQALRESGSRNSSTKSHVSSGSLDSIYNEEFDELLSDDVLVNDVITEEKVLENVENENCEGSDKKAETTDAASANKISKIASTTCERDSQIVAELGSNDRTCQIDSDVTNENEGVAAEVNDIDDVVTNMREEIEEAIERGKELRVDLEEQIAKDTNIGQGNVRTYNKVIPDEEDVGVDRRSSADSGVQEDRTDGDESSGCHSAIVSPLMEVVKSDLQLLNDIGNETESQSDLVVSIDVVKKDLSDKEIPSSLSKKAAESDIEILIDHDSEAKSEKDDVTYDIDSSERTESDSNKCNDLRTLEENSIEDSVAANELCEKPNESDVSKVNDRTIQLESSDGETEGDIVGALDETEEERIERLREEALARHLKTISKDVLSYMDKLLSMLVAVYEELDSAIAKETCISVIEDHFFQIIWQPLLTLFRRVNVRQETTAAIAMTKYRHAAPEHIGVIKKLCLIKVDGVHKDSDDQFPYWQAVQELRKLTQYYTPLDKLECIVRSSRIIIQCVGDYYEQQGKARQNSETAVGCDDLLPILSYVIIKSAMPQIVSECSAMEEFIHEGYLFGEEGYCLTTLQTALGYVLKLAKD